MLKWFKTIKERLFGDDDEEQTTESINEEQTTESINEEQYIERPTENFDERPAFRFPIITDAEIYGWEEEEHQEVRQQEKVAPLREFDDDYEPIPLYQNERWPENNVPVNVYRANDDRPFYGKTKEFEEEYFTAGENAYEIEEKFDKVIRKNPANRFVPTEVPSPIYGFSSRRKLSELQWEKERADAHPLLKESMNFRAVDEEHDLKVEEHQAVQQTAEEREPFVDQLNEIETNEPLAAVVQEEVETAQQVEEEIVATTVHERLEDSSIKEPITEEASVEEIPGAVEVVEQVTEDEIEPERTDEPVLAEVLEEVQPKEKIVPFNVLMLKSDKEKLKKSEPKPPVVQPPKVEQREPEKTEPSVVDEVALEMEEEPEHYVFPPIDYLIPPESQIEDTEWLEMQSDKLEESLSHFGVTATVIEAVQGPTVTRFEFTVGQGTKVSRVRNLADDLKLTLAAKDIRIQAPIPGKSSIGIEIPNRQTRPVRISEVIQTDEFMNSSSPLEAVLGLGLTGTPETIDLRKMPHGMIAGATGSGKSVCINSILVSLLYKASPSDLKMMLIDPKMVELAPFNGIPHLISPVITDVKAATAALKWAVNEMERRYELLAHAGVRDIERYNKAAIENRQYSLKMPYLLIVIDELADLMMVAPADVEVSISRIAQKARACGIHLIIATQRPSVDVITGTIKANIPTRIAFSVSSQVDSRTIIDTNGADRLLGKGDMLYIGNGQSTAVRLQGTFVTDDEIERIIEHVQREASPTYLFGQDELLKSVVEEEDSLFTEACLFVYEQNSASTSMLQRNFSIGYNRAAKLMDRMEKHGFISPQQGSKARDVYLTESDLEQLSESVL